MCGIAGLFDPSGSGLVSAPLLKAMTDQMVHRGPDDEGFYVSGPVGLGHRRLSIIDLAEGHQPLTNEDGTVWVVFNGEIYNFLDLRKSLMAKGHVFKTSTDTEVIVHLYEEKGEDCFRELRGMFAIAIWDEPKRKLILGRDRVGKKPLFYHYNGSRIVFGSEIKAILQVPGISRDVDLEALSDYFSLLYVPAPKTIYKQVRKLLPGHYLTISNHGLKDVEYWDIAFNPELGVSAEAWAERLAEKLRESVAMRLISDVPLGAFLSGGVDSSAVVAMMAERNNGRVRTSSIGFDNQAFNELPYAREIARYFDTDHHEEVVRPDAVGIIEKLAWHYDEPFADSSAVPTYYVSKIARQHVTVALSGDGGDENFAGYRRYYFDQREQRLRGVFPAGFRRQVFGTLSELYPKADWAPRIFRGKATLENLSCSHIEGYFRSVSAFHPALKAALLSGDVRRDLRDYDTADLFREYYDKMAHADPLSRIQYVDIKTYLVDDILVKVDRASMANSLEVRSPILDHEFMELAARIPSSLKLKGMSGKLIFKQMLKPLLPESVLNRKKMGFAIPLAQWFRGDLKSMAEGVIFPANGGGFIDNEFAKSLWQQHQRGSRDRSTELWTLMMFRLWERQFLTA